MYAEVPFACLRFSYVLAKVSIARMCPPDNSVITFMYWGTFLADQVTG